MSGCGFVEEVVGVFISKRQGKLAHGLTRMYTDFVLGGCYELVVKIWGKV